MREWELEWDIKPWNLIIIKAKYRVNVLPEYKGNLFIEATPEYCGEEVIERIFTGKPEKMERDRKYSFDDLYLMTYRLENFLMPFKYHFELALTLYSMVINGYDRRFCKGIEGQLERIRDLNEVINQIDKETDTYDVLNYLKRKNGTTARSLFIIGESGTGKTLTLEMLRQIFPDAIIHHEYKGIPLTRLQIPYIKIDCPRNGRVTELCQRFFRQIDIIAGTNYTDKLSLGNNNVARMIIEMDRISLKYAVGILVVDEIQNLVDTETKNEQAQALNFLVELSNTLGIPTIFVGTPEAQVLLKKRVAVIRRLTGEGEKRIEKFKKDDMRWEKFIEELWQYQYLPEYVPLNKSLKNTIYKHTQGNVAQIVNLYGTIQRKALFEEKPTITVGFIEKVVKEWLPTLKQLNEDLASGNKRRINRYRDIGWDYAIEEDNTINRDKEYLERTKEAQDKELHMNKIKRIEMKEELTKDMIEIGIFGMLDRIDIALTVEEVVLNNPVDEDYNKLKQSCIEACIEKLKEVKLKLDKKKEKALAKDDTVEVREEQDDRYSLIHIYDKAKKQKRHPKELLEEYGYIRNPFEEFVKEE